MTRTRQRLRRRAPAAATFQDFFGAVRVRKGVPPRPPPAPYKGPDGTGAGAGSGSHTGDADDPSRTTYQPGAGPVKAGLSGSPGVWRAGLARRARLRSTASPRAGWMIRGSRAALYSP